MRKRLFILSLLILCFTFILTACSGKNSASGKNPNSSPACTHEWKDATCTLPKTCSLCDAQEGTALGHDYKISNIKEATCTETGEKTSACSRCKDTYTESITASHDYVESTEKEPTCEQVGTKLYTCSKCGDAKREEIAAMGHNYSSSVTKQPSCTATGTKAFTCYKCYKSYNEVIAATGHSWNDATCTAPKTCSVCNTKEGKALGHTTDNGLCERCGQVFSKPIKFQGHGDKVISGVNIPSGSFMVNLKHTGSRNFITRLYYGEEEYDYQLLSNEIGNYNGQCALTENSGLEIKDGILEVIADGDWTIEFTRVTGTCTLNVHGKGDKVTGLINATQSRYVVKLSHDGQRNFIVKVHLYNGKWYDYELIANEIGKYNGETIIALDKGKQYYIEVMADGNWTIDFGVGDPITTYK